MKFLHSKIVIACIILLATVLRFYQLATVPALNADEAAIGYNAYSLLLTGRDEHDNPWPLHFQSFNDYKPGLFFYIVLPFVKLLGLTELAVRIPGATLGVITVLLVYLLVGELFKKQNFKLFASFLLAISPWHIHFSRGGWEVNAATFFITLGVLAFVKGVRLGRQWFVMAVLAFVASMYTYHAARVVVPLLVIGLVFVYRRKVWIARKLLMVPLVVGVLLVIPLVRELVGSDAVSRASGVSIFADRGIIERINQQRGEHVNASSITALALHNKIINYSYEFFSNWSDHFWGEFLFVSGDEIQRNKVPDFGLLYLLQLPLVVIGLVAIARRSTNWGIILWWLAVSPTAAALTFQSPHALRAHNMVIPLTIISAYGGVNLVSWLRQSAKSRLLLTIYYLLFTTLLVWDFTRYLHEYYLHMAKAYPFSSQYGLKELAGYVADNYDKYPQFVITDRYDQPYILLLFYLKYPPVKFQQNHVLSARDRFGFSTVRDFDKFHFEGLKDWDTTVARFRGALIAGTDKEIPDVANIVHQIDFPDGSPAFQLVSN